MNREPETEVRAAEETGNAAEEWLADAGAPAARAVTAYEDCPELSREQAERILRKA